MLFSLLAVAFHIIFLCCRRKWTHSWK